MNVDQAKREATRARRHQLEDALAAQLRLAHVPEFVREFRFHGERMWRFDFAWPDQLVAIECEGAVFTGGRHTRGRGFEDDCEKLNEAAAAGWRVLRVTGDQIKAGQALVWIERALA